MKMAGAEKQRSTEQRNTVTMGVPATQDSASEWRKVGAQVNIRPRQARLFRDFEREVRSLSTRITYHELKPIDLIEAPRTQYDIPRVMHGQKPVSLMRYLIRVHSLPGD